MLAHARGLRWMYGLMAVLSLALIFSAATSTVHAQAPRGLSGTVLDPDSKAVVGAAVVIRNEATGDIVDDDRWERKILRPPRCRRTASSRSAPGFETVRRSGVQVSK